MREVTCRAAESREAIPSLLGANVRRPPNKVALAVIRALEVATASTDEHE